MGASLSSNDENNDKCLSKTDMSGKCFESSINQELGKHTNANNKSLRAAICDELAVNEKRYIEFTIRGDATSSKDYQKCLIVETEDYLLCTTNNTEKHFFIEIPL